MMRDGRWKCRRLILGCAMAMAVPALSFGQQQGDGGGPTQAGGPPGGGQHGPPTPAQELQRLDSRLSLTASEKTAILPILEERQTEMEALRSSGGDRATEHEKRTSIFAATNQSIRVLLTEAQQKIFDTMSTTKPPRPNSSGEESAPPPAPQG